MAGVQVYRDHQCCTLTFSGAAVGNEHVEADSMAVLAKSLSLPTELSVPTEEMVFERNARFTWKMWAAQLRLWL